MLNRRSVSRFHLVQPLPGFLEHGDDRHRGEIIELSTAGFRLRLSNVAEDAFLDADRSDDLGEIVFREQALGGFGRIRFARAEGSNLWIGFQWDENVADLNLQTTFSIIADLVSTGSAGTVNFSNGVVSLAGHVSSALAGDVQLSVGPKLQRVSLQDCTSIDLSGLALLSTLEDAKVPLAGANVEVHALLQRYRQREHR